jgi:hypothetical protein
MENVQVTGTKIGFPANHELQAGAAKYIIPINHLFR